MSLHIKPINMAKYRDELFPDWVLYETGNFAHPLIIIDSGEMTQLVQDYCEYRGMEFGIKKVKK